MIVILLICSLLYLHINGLLLTRKDENIIEAYNNENLIRFHIIAHSNSPLDQKIKRSVRREVDDFLNLDKNNITEKKLQHIEEKINHFLQEKEVRYSSKVKFGEYYFPRRKYGNTVLPAGEYKALKIELGRAEGANWWCVLFPSFCYEKKESSNDSSEGNNQFKNRASNLDDIHLAGISSESQQALVLGKGAMKNYSISEKKEPKIEFKLKIVEWFKKLK